MPPSLPPPPGAPRRRVLLAAGGGALAALALGGTGPAATLLAATPARAQRSQTLPDFADLADRVLPAVVNISITGEEAVQIPPELRGTPAERFLRERLRGARRLFRGAGSGFIIDPAGHVVTNNHVVGNATRVTVSLQSGASFPARVVGSDDLTDLALLKIDAPRPLPFVVWGSSAALRVGQWVLAAGNPFGLGGTLTAGIVSARGREIGAGPFDDFIQTDAAINPGNSGGPLFNTAGEVVGISTAIYSPTGAYAGIGFATPSDLARGVIEQLRRDGRIERGWLGVSVQDLNGEVPEGGSAARRGAGRPAGGVLIAAVERGSPAARAGLRPGDVVVALDGERIETSRALVRNVAALPPGQTVRLTVLRDGREREIRVQVGRRPQNPEG
ncbi:trypsin-like peptidase domain-containing protein [Caldovatus aquaticus]|uniref:Trypsin-like peptidase domain-containing protein n=1 Tax=Caldovatus aquaticus TaxID=2865671 RepID=A0ABS7F5X1_9PROT|nr:trypsin-like peptidase domain-containing protein [Caldovatus aquaticus]MBW8271017.1 trypsin-like peptidase domain-containing protein [Caldovatus aquaticus]